VDTSVLVKWFDEAEGDQVAEARLIYDAYRDGRLTAYITDLTHYEFGNVVVRAKGWPAAQVAEALDALLVIFGPPLVPSPAWRREAAHLAAEHRLSFYDASFAAAARALGAVLLSADKRLLSAGLAQSPARFVELHGHHIRNRP
jgi:predicted nucleic acid-binding protein